MFDSFRNQFQSNFDSRSKRPIPQKPHKLRSKIAVGAFQLGRLFDRTSIQIRFFSNTFSMVRFWSLLAPFWDPLGGPMEPESAPMATQWNPNPPKRLPEISQEAARDPSRIRPGRSTCPQDTPLSHRPPFWTDFGTFLGRSCGLCDVPIMLPKPYVAAAAATAAVGPRCGPCNDPCTRNAPCNVPILLHRPRFGPCNVAVLLPGPCNDPSPAPYRSGKLRLRPRSDQDNCM